MANVDRPNGFTPIKTISGAPVSSLVRTIGVTDGTDLFLGDLLNLESGLAAVGATADTALLGVAVGFGKIDSMSGEFGGPFNPDQLDVTYYDDSASVHTEWVCYYVPADDVIFEAQTATVLDLAIGATADLSVATAGSTVTGISGQEITTSSNGELTVVEHLKQVGNDRTLVHGRYGVMVTRAAQALHA